MKKISYYVAAFALCCGVSQTLTSCIEETEEPDDVKAMRQAEIARINANAELLKASVLTEEANAAKTNADVAYRNAETAAQLLTNSVKEGAITEEIAKEVATFKKDRIELERELATANLPANLNASCPSYDAYVMANIDLNGGTGILADGSTYSKEVADSYKQILADKQDALDNGTTELMNQLNYIAELQTNVAAAEQALKDHNKDYNEQKKAYDDKETSTCRAADESTYQDWYGTFDASDNETRADNWAKAGIVWTYLKTLAENTVKQAQDELALAKDNKSFVSDYETLYTEWKSAKDNYDAALAAYNEAKALYEAELAAVSAVK